MMPPVVCALPALLGSRLRWRCPGQLQVPALQHQVAVYEHTVPRPHSADRLLWAWLSHPSGARCNRLKLDLGVKSRPWGLASSLRAASGVSRCHRSLRFSPVTSFRDR